MFVLCISVKHNGGTLCSRKSTSTKWGIVSVWPANGEVLTQAELSELVDCSNNHMSHIESGQTKVSLSLLLKLSYALDTSLDFFLLDTPYARRDALIDNEISQKLARCDRQTLLSVNKILDVLLEQQSYYKKVET